MCQVYYVCGFIELIYFVTVSFNQGWFMHNGWAERRKLQLEWIWLKCYSKSEEKQLYNETIKDEKDSSVISKSVI